ncbi:Succinate dehydrogenase assembly factor 3, mitochondrial [Smittium culicis]|uniref:Succinate dehydrogenase assembly factor 3 n=1 Tax=Smittium culicis TaxID=133412 RepID=A0A1R1XSZ7_9FUNG|nr:Succinate dehydrogenase assembly factor 3, mitochondrial [Smittium culicis]OMJ17669.1 Succinate dehydrogenase assembly factor 3, mitochondrial [Smittium culicis]
MNKPLKLYADILRLHRSLPKEFRVIGDAYVKQEFRAHQKVSDSNLLLPFFREWRQYLTVLQQQTSQIENQNVDTKIGLDLAPDLIEKINDEKAEQIINLKSETATIYNQNS